MMMNINSEMVLECRIISNLASEHEVGVYLKYFYFPRSRNRVFRFLSFCDWWLFKVILEIKLVICFYIRII